MHSILINIENSISYQNFIRNIIVVLTKNDHLVRKNLLVPKLLDQVDEELFVFYSSEFAGY